MAISKLTDRSILSMPPPAAGQRTVWDSALPGFGVRVSMGGTKSFVVCYRVDGRKRFMTLGRYPGLSLRDARLAARQAMGRVALGTDPALEKISARQRESFGALAETYLERHAKAKKRSWRDDERQIKKDLLPAWGAMKAASVTRRDVVELLDTVVDRGAPIQANRLLALARKIFNFGIQRGLLESNPCHLVPAPSRERRRERVLTEEEIRRLWIALEEDQGPVSLVHKLRLVTAQRQNEVMSMRWVDVDLEGGWWTIPAERAKNGLSHRVPLGSIAISILSRLSFYRPQREEWVFPSPTVAGQPVRYAQSANRRIREASGLNDFQPHDLRRTAASYMASAGTPRLVIKKILNHVESDVTAVYDRHSYDREKREAIQAWNARLEIMLSEQER